jgi:hypothetical protein
MKKWVYISGSFLLLSAAAILSGCQAGYGMKVGYQRKMIRHTGYTADQIYNAARASLDKLGRVTSADEQTGIIKGEIPPYAVQATVSQGSPWLKLEGREEEHGAWKRDESKGEWFLSIDGRLYYSVGAATMKDALKKWSHDINLRIP